MADDTKFDYIVRRLDTVEEKVSDTNVTLGSHIARFEAHMEKLESQSDQIKRNTDILNRNTASLEHHIERTDLLQEYVTKMDQRFSVIELEAIQKKARRDGYIANLVLLGKLGGAVGALGAIAAALKLAIQVLLANG